MSNEIFNAEFPFLKKLGDVSCTKFWFTFIIYLTIARRHTYFEAGKVRNYFKETISKRVRITSTAAEGSFTALGSMTYHWDQMSIFLN